MVQLKTKKQTLQHAKEKMIFLTRVDKKTNKIPQPQELTIDEVIKQVINHHIGIMM